MPTLIGLMGHGEASRSRQLWFLLVLSCAGGATDVMENVFDGEACEVWRQQRHAHDPRLHGRCAGMLPGIMNLVFPEGDQPQCAF